MITLIAFILLSVTGLPTSPDHEVLGDWKVDKVSEDIEISYRFLMVGDTFKTREMRIRFELDTGIDAIMPMYNSANNFQQWSAGIERCELLDKDSSGWTLYNLYDIPWPFKTRDLVTRYDMEDTEDGVRLSMTSDADAYPITEGVMRMRYYEGYWLFESINDNRTNVSFHSIAFSKPVAPRFIQDPIVQRAFIKSIERLRTMLSA